MIKIRKTRAEKADESRRALFDAAVEVVGKEGYAAASVQKITALANVANGTFYNYFEDRQDLFNQLLPTLGEQMLTHIRAQLDDSLDGIERERRRLEAYFDFCRKTPGFLRVLNEAEVFAPKAYQRHVRQMYEGYLRSFRRSLDRGEIVGYSEDDLAAVVFMLMGVRSYLTMLYQHGYVERKKSSISALIDVYSRVLESGLFKSSDEPSAKSKAPSSVKKRAIPRASATRAGNDSKL